MPVPAVPQPGPGRAGQPSMSMNVSKSCPQVACDLGHPADRKAGLDMSQDGGYAASIEAGESEVHANLLVGRKADVSVKTSIRLGENMEVRWTFCWQLHRRRRFCVLPH